MRKIKTSAGINNYHWDYKEFCYLALLLSKTKNLKEIINVFIDLHTPKEISEIIRRLIIASMLNEDKTYTEISETLGATSITIAKISQKFHRPKSILAELLKRTGGFEKYLKDNITDERDWLTKMIDRKLYSRSLGLLGKK